MKRSIYLFVTALVAMTLVSCNEKSSFPNPGDITLDSIPVTIDPDPTPDPEGVKVPKGTINVYEAVKIGKSLPKSDKDNKYPTEDTYYIKGWVHSFDAKERAKADFEDKFKQYGNDYVYLSACNDGSSSKKLFYCYRILGKNGAPLPDHDALQIGDFVVAQCKILNFGGTIESDGTCSIYSSNNPHFNEVFPPFPGCPEPGPGEISVNRAKEISDSIGSGKTTTEKYKIRAVVTSVTDKSITSYGNLTFNISSDGEVSALCYRLKGKDGKNFTDLNQLLVGDTVLVEAKIQNYNGTCEPTQGNVIESTNPNYNAKFNPAQ